MQASQADFVLTNVSEGLKFKLKTITFLKKYLLIIFSQI